MILNPKHGVNPTIRQCFWCGEDTGEILLLGDAMKEQAPMHSVTDYNPCDRCTDAFDQGILIIEVSRTPLQDKQPDLQGTYPTGAHWVITEEAVTRLLNASAAESILKARKAFITKQDAIVFGLYPTEEERSMM
jgi:hypothetical protein